MNIEKLNSQEQEAAIQDFLDFLAIPTVSGTGPQGAYDTCAQWLLKFFRSIGLDPFLLPESLPGKPIVVCCWKGTDPSLGPLLVNSHYDVVPAMQEHWTFPAFSPTRTPEGRIYGRGAQDMKCVCVETLVALRALVQRHGQQQQPSSPYPRTLWFSFVPDEEIGGTDGMGVMLESRWFRTLDPPLSLALDEGLASVDDSFSLFYGERLPWWVQFTATGATGHASRFIDGTAVEMIVALANKALAFRQEQQRILHGALHESAACSHAVVAKKELAAAEEEEEEDKDHGTAAPVCTSSSEATPDRGSARPKVQLGDVTSINLTHLRAGVEAGGRPVVNVIPSEAQAVFDIRISPLMEPEDVRALLDGWVKQVVESTPGLPADGGMQWQFINPGAPKHATTAVDDSNPWWVLMRQFFEARGFRYNTLVFPAATDSRFLRALGYKAFGFSPIRHSPVLLHEHDEYLDAHVFIEGCNIYMELLPTLLSNSTC